MSYPMSTYGMPQQQQMLPPLPYPAHQLQTQPMITPPGSPSFIPNPSYLPNGYQQIYPFIVSEAMNALSEKAGANPLRTFLYNQTSFNGWNNQDFAALIDGLVRLIEVKFNSGTFRDIQQCVNTCAIYFAELNAAANILKFPALQEGMGQQEVNAVNSVLNDLKATMGEIERFYRQGGLQPQQPQNQWNDPNAYRPPQQVQPQQAWSRHQPQSAGTNWRQVQNQQQLNQAAVPSVNTTRGYGNQTDMQDSGDPVVNRYGRRAPTGVALNPPQLQQPQARVAQYDNRDQARQQVAQAMIGNIPGRTQPAVQQPPAAPTLLVPSESVKFKPSDKFQVNVAYDPNEVIIFYEVTPEGHLLPSVSKKADIDMDKSKHLMTPSFVATPPAALDTVDSKVRGHLTEKALTEDVLSIADVKKIENIEFAYKDKSRAASVSMDELWLNNEVQLALVKKAAKRMSVYRSLGVHLTPLTTLVDSKAMINAVAQCETFEAACKTMRTFASQLREGICAHGDDKTLTFINKRLTQALNDWLVKQLAVTTGCIDSFIEDAPAVPKFVADKVTPSFGAKVVEAQSRIISTSLKYAEEEFERDQNSNLLGEVANMEKLIEGVSVTYFYDYLTMTSLDLYSTELRFDVPKGTETSVGVFKAQTPLLYQIADNTFTHARALGLEFDRHLVRTADGVLLELSISAMNPDFYLVKPVDK